MGKPTRRRSEAGAALVEGAIAASLAFMLIFGVVWGAMLFRSYLTVSHAAKNAARIGAISANDEQSDYLILQAIKSSLSATSPSSIQQIVIFKASSPSADPPLPCLTASVANTCNVYSSADLSRPAADFVSATYQGDTYWPPDSRSAARSSTSTFIGVYVKADARVKAFGFVGPNSVSHQEVVQIESRSY